MRSDPNQYYTAARFPQALHRMNHRLWLLLGFLIVFLLIGGAGVASVTLYANAATEDNVIRSTVQRYYETIQQGNYDVAYNTYFDQSASIANQSASVLLLSQLDLQKGRLSSYTITQILNDPDANGTSIAHVTVNVKRSRKSSYIIQITLKLEGNNWKITYADDI